MHISSVRVLFCSAAVTSKSQSVSLIVRFYPLKRKESSPVATAGSQRLGYISNMMAHCPFYYTPACRQTLPFFSSSRIITVSVAGDLSAVIEADTSVWLSDLRDRNTTRVLGVYFGECRPWSVAVSLCRRHSFYCITLHAVLEEWAKG